MTTVALVMTAACVGCADHEQRVEASPDTAASIQSRVPRLKELRARWQQVMKVGGVAGMSLVVVHGDKVIYSDALGVRDPENNLPVTLDTMFYIASCTKSYMAMGIMALVEEGKVELDAPVKKYLPRLELADAEATATLTIRDLLSHAKGLNSGPAVLLDAYTGTITEDRYYHWLSKEKPTGKFQYTNVHFTLAGRVAEAVTGQSWKDYLNRRIFEPAGMRYTSGYATKMYDSDNVAFPCVHDGTSVRPTLIRKTDSVMHAAGGLGTTANDLSKWLRVNLNGGVVDGVRILSAEGIENMHRQHAKGVGRSNYPHRRRLGYGLGWFVGDYHKIPMVDHGGGYVGTSASISFMPSKKLGVAVVSNASGVFSDLVAASIYQELLDLPRSEVLARVERSAKRNQERMRKWISNFEANPVTGETLSLDIENYIGEYYNEHIGTAIVKNIDGALQVRIGDLPLRLASVTTDEFEIGVMPGSNETGRFIVGENGSVTMFVYDERECGELKFARE